MNNETLIRELRRIAADKNHCCLGCGYEHNCSSRGCAIIREALARLGDGALRAHAVINWLGDARCSNCGQDVYVDGSYCRFCGATLDEPEEWDE